MSTRSAVILRIRFAPFVYPVQSPKRIAAVPTLFSGQGNLRQHTRLISIIIDPALVAAKSGKHAGPDTPLSVANRGLAARGLP
jgi:hypothetical protein